MAIFPVLVLAMASLLGTFCDCWTVLSNLLAFQMPI